MAVSQRTRWGRPLASVIAAVVVVVSVPIDGSTSASPTAMGPRAVVGQPLGRVRSLVTSGDHACAVSRAGALKCWGGWNEAPGILGQPTTVLSLVGGIVGDDEVPSVIPLVALGSGRSVDEVAVGMDHICVLLDNGQVKCVGSNELGQSGIKVPTLSPRTLARVPAVRLGEGRTATSIAATRQETCALLDDGQVRCWGSSGGPIGLVTDVYDPQIGLGEHPTAYPTLDLGRIKVAEIDLAQSHGCARTTTGKLRCWGAGRAFGTTQSNVGGQNQPPPADFPLLAFDRPVIDVEVGNEVTCVLLDNGEVRCLGSNFAGVLGTGTPSAVRKVANTRPIRFGGGRKAVRLSLSDVHACAILDDGHLKCWGYNGLGSLGLGNRTRYVGKHQTPADVPDVSLPAGKTPAEVSTGTHTTCVVFTDRTSTCFGANGSGGLGLGHYRDIGDGPGEMGDALVLHSL